MRPTKKKKAPARVKAKPSARAKAVTPKPGKAKPVKVKPVKVKAVKVKAKAMKPKAKAVRSVKIQATPRRSLEKGQPLVKTSAAKPANNNSGDQQLLKFEAAIKLFHSRNFAAALKLFSDATTGSSLDVAHSARQHMSMCEHRLASLSAGNSEN